MIIQVEDFRYVLSRAHGMAGSHFHLETTNKGLPMMMLVVFVGTILCTNYYDLSICSYIDRRSFIA